MKVSTYTLVISSSELAGRNPRVCLFPSWRLTNMYISMSLVSNGVRSPGSWYYVFPSDSDFCGELLSNAAGRSELYIHLHSSKDSILFQLLT